MLRRPCWNCSAPMRGDRCYTCGRKARKQPSLSRAARGYDSQYDRARRTMIRRAWELGLPCCICGKAFQNSREITAEHIVPLRKGGSSDLRNIGPAHLSCNLSRKPARYL